MTKTEIYEALTVIFRDLFMDDDIILKSDMSADDVDGWDSGANLNIIAAVEQRFQIKVRTMEIAQLMNVGDIAKMVESKL